MSAVPPHEGLPLISQANIVMCLAVGCKRPRRQVRSTLWSLNSQPLEGPLSEALYQHPPLVSRF